MTSDEQYMEANPDAVEQKITQAIKPTFGKPAHFTTEEGTQQAKSHGQQAPSIISRLNPKETGDKVPRESQGGLSFKMNG